MKKIAYLLAIILSLYMIISILHVKSIPKDLCITNTINNCLDIEHDNYYSLNGLTINTKIRCMEDTSIPSLFRMEIPKKIVHYYHNTYLYNIHYNARYVYNYLEKGEALLPHIKLIDNSIINKNQADVVGLLINKSLSNVDFSQCGFVNMIIDNTIFENCNFDNTIINSPKFVLYGTNYTF